MSGLLKKTLSYAADFLSNPLVEIIVEHSEKEKIDTSSDENFPDPGARRPGIRRQKTQEEKRRPPEPLKGWYFLAPLAQRKNIFRHGWDAL